MKVKERRKKKDKDDILRNEAFLVDKDGEDDIQVENDEINFEENLVNILKAGEPKVSLVNNRGNQFQNMCMPISSTVVEMGKIEFWN